jgi:hypothetical protein
VAVRSAFFYGCNAFKTGSPKILVAPVDHLSLQLAELDCTTEMKPAEGLLFQPCNQKIQQESGWFNLICYLSWASFCRNLSNVV